MTHIHHYQDKNLSYKIGKYPLGDNKNILLIFQNKADTNYHLDQDKTYSSKIHICFVLNILGILAYSMNILCIYDCYLWNNQFHIFSSWNHLDNRDIPGYYFCKFGILGFHPNSIRNYKSHISKSLPPHRSSILSVNISHTYCLKGSRYILPSIENSNYHLSRKYNHQLIICITSIDRLNLRNIHFHIINMWQSNHSLSILD